MGASRRLANKFTNFTAQTTTVAITDTITRTFKNFIYKFKKKLNML